MFIHRLIFSDDDEDTPIVRPVKRLNMIKYKSLIDSDASDHEQTSYYDDDDDDNEEEYHTLSGLNNSNSGKDHLAMKDFIIWHHVVYNVTYFTDICC